MKVAARQTLRRTARPATVKSNSQAEDNAKMSTNRRANAKSSLSPNSIKKNNWKNNHAKSISSLMHDPVLISLRKQCFSQDLDYDFTTIDSTTLENFHRHIREYKQSCALNNNYEEAQVSLKLSKLVFKEIQRRNFSNYISTTVGKRSTTSMSVERRSTISSSFTDDLCDEKFSSCSNGRQLFITPSSSIDQNQNNDQIQCELQIYSEEVDKNNLSDTNFVYDNLIDNYDFQNDISEDEDKESIAKFNQKTDEKRSYLLNLQELQLQRFENIWTKEMPKKYRKPSARLLEIKEKEHALALTRDYEAAEELHKLAEELIIQETKNAQSRLVNDYKAARKQLMARFAKEMESFEEARKEKFRILMTRNQEKKDAEEKRDQVIVAQKLSSQKLFKDLFQKADINVINECQSLPLPDDEPKQPRPTTASVLIMAVNSGKSDNLQNQNYNQDSINTPSPNKKARFDDNCSRTSLSTPCNISSQINRSKSAPKTRLNSPIKSNSRYRKTPSKKITKIIISTDSSDSEPEVESKTVNENTNIHKNYSSNEKHVEKAQFKENSIQNDRNKLINTKPMPSKKEGNVDKKVIKDKKSNNAINKSVTNTKSNNNINSINSNNNDTNSDSSNIDSDIDNIISNSSSVDNNAIGINNNCNITNYNNSNINNNDININHNDININNNDININNNDININNNDININNNDININNNGRNINKNDSNINKNDSNINKNDSNINKNDININNNDSNINNINNTMNDNNYTAYNTNCNSSENNYNVSNSNYNYSSINGNPSDINHSITANNSKASNNNFSNSNAQIQKKNAPVVSLDEIDLPLPFLFNPNYKSKSAEESQFLPAEKTNKNNQLPVNNDNGVKKKKKQKKESNGGGGEAGKCLLI